MRIVDRKTFLQMPAGTVYSKYAPCWFEALQIKGDTVGDNDFCYQQLVDALDVSNSDEFSEKLFESQETGFEIGMDFYCQGRDGCFEHDQLFAVFSKEDLEGLVNRLIRAYKGE